MYKLKVTKILKDKQFIIICGIKVLSVNVLKSSISFQTETVFIFIYNINLISVNLLNKICNHFKQLRITHLVAISKFQVPKY